MITTSLGAAAPRHLGAGTAGNSVFAAETHF
jgi:hypothetical protein